MSRRWQTPLMVMASGAMVFMLSAGCRQTFGLFLRPMSTEMGWGREIFSLSVALLTLLMGFMTPVMGAIADKFGSGRVILFGGLMWGLGLYGMSVAATPLALVLSAGVIVGLGAASTSVAIAIGAVGRMVDEAHRSRALGVVTAGGSVGQMLLLPVGQGLISVFGWSHALALLGGVMILLVPAALGLSGRTSHDGVITGQQRIGEALAEARRHRGYLLLTAGFFVCGFHVSFIAVHLPSFVVDNGLPPRIGAIGLVLVGLFNILGSYAWAGWGGRYRKNYLLSTIYLLRAGVITLLLVLPLTTVTVLVFTAAMGFLWLGTVPLTSGLVAQILGVRYLSLLFGIVFMSHQVGGFLGAWLGGYVFDLTASYNPVWYLAIVLGVISALLHAPINDRPLQRIARVEETA